MATVVGVSGGVGGSGKGQRAGDDGGDREEPGEAEGA